MSAKKVIIVTRMQNVLIMMALSLVSAIQVTMEMGLLIVSVSSKINILKLHNFTLIMYKLCVVSVTLIIGSTLGSLSFVLVVGIVGAIICICCFIERYSKANRKKRFYL